MAGKKKQIRVTKFSESLSIVKPTKLKGLKEIVSIYFKLKQNS